MTSNLIAVSIEALLMVSGMRAGAAAARLPLVAIVMVIYRGVARHKVVNVPLSEESLVSDLLDIHCIYFP